MDDFKGVEIAHCFKDFADDEGSSELCKSFPLADVFIEIFTVDVLSYDIDMLFASDGVVVADYLWMLKNLHNLALVVQNCNGLRVQLFSRNIFEGVGLACYFVGSAVNH